MLEVPLLKVWRRVFRPRRYRRLTRRYWYHFTSLVAIAVFMVMGMSAFKAVFWASVLAVASSYCAARPR